MTALFYIVGIVCAAGFMHDLWAFLAKNYLVLRKGSYSVGGTHKKEIKRK